MKTLTKIQLCGGVILSTLLTGVVPVLAAPSISSHQCAGIHTKTKDFSELLGGHESVESAHNLLQSARVTENIDVSETILEWRSDKKWWTLADYKNRLKKVISLERWGAAPIQFEYLSSHDLPAAERDLCEKLIAKSKSTALLKIGKNKLPSGQEDSLPSVEVAALEIIIKSGKTSRIFISSADYSKVANDRVERSFATLMGRDGFAPEDIREIRFFHSHPDWNVELSEGDSLFAQQWRDRMRSRNIFAPFHMYAVSQMQNEILLSHIGLNP